ncbi:hypothetical protein DV495_002388 [Geotrichum candidum]|nr:hypothetical protein DV452_004135 [Geotrichum candidum]KAF5129354.1 hypothetical protein DV495_002388 [Geotrichum candidum]KAF7498536.1 hypothetical protein DV113_003430 [Geotrichum candidum]KAI8133394.1 hypothetical protein DUD61_002933 [Geotrichum candidum]KAI9210828.1 hypothetical protein DS838_004274 [Geotrichum bryndzae]
MSGNNSNNSNAGDDADMWDDTALIQGWDDAVAEYQRYHSIYHHEGGPAPTQPAKPRPRLCKSAGQNRAARATSFFYRHAAATSAATTPATTAATGGCTVTSRPFYNNNDWANAGSDARSAVATE